MTSSLCWKEGGKKKEGEREGEREKRDREGGREGRRKGGPFACY